MHYSGGNTVSQMWDALKAGRSGIDSITHFDASSFPTKFAAEVKDFHLTDYIPNPERFEYAGHNIRFAIGAATQAVQDSGLADGQFDPARFGVYLGAGEGQQDFFLFMKLIAEAQKDGQFDVAEFTRRGLEQLNPKFEMEQEPNMPAGHLASLFNAQGPNLNCLTACAASSQAIGEATEIIRLGEADVMLSGGAHSMIHPFGLTGFNLLTALSTNNANPQGASRPFDKNRDGFVLGEGAGMLVLEELSTHKAARRSTAKSSATGRPPTPTASPTSTRRPRAPAASTWPSPTPAQSEDIDYINATARAAKSTTRSRRPRSRTPSERAYQTPISSTKSMMGHLIAAAGSAEAIVCLLAIREGILPPTTNYADPDPECDLDYVPNTTREAPVRNALSNSFGFGGQNVSLVFSAFKG